ncbi:hypothetical protein HU230_0033330 [Bradyrhizobium quebecense]|uniref:Uncharacterized protein n=1 Tax=Bradyrhizobium quebecense TaxID=2748629 RepID=A0A973WYR0_9BRAD|nr:hypothetical protein [Bradyrhizobium quebecense]UGA43110.1 hypothetical protein HU230_0033330 [Bradyrhizobium quebecense]
MDDEVRKAAAGAVVEKFRDLMEQRADAVRRRGEVEREIRGFDRALYDCRAAGRLFGVDIELPEDVRPGVIIPPRLQARAPSQATLFPKVPSAFFSQPATPKITAGDLTQSRPAPTVASTTLPAGSEPSVRDLILHYLRIAGAAGEKAAVLRRRIETFLNRQIHYKTVGMSLYRLSKETPPLVRRQGQTWFLSEAGMEAKNPSAGTPGL